MAGITSNNKKFKTVHIVFTIIEFIALVLSINKLISINYANIYQYNRASGIEHLPLYFGIAVVLLTMCILSVGILLFCVKYSAKILIAYGIFAIFLIIAVVIGVKLPNVTEYDSSHYDQSHSAYLPIDAFEYKEQSSDYYFYRNVDIGDIRWVGSSSYKDFAGENAEVDLTEEVSESTVYMNYYYLFDESGYLVRDCSDKMNWGDILLGTDYDSEELIGNYTVYEYEDCYELILESDSEVFYLSASKNKRTEYDENDLIKIADKLMLNLKNA